MADFDSENSRTAMSSSPVSDVVSVMPVDMLLATSRFASLSPQCSPVSAEVVDRGCGVAGIRPCCHVFGYVDYYDPVLTIQPPVFTGVYIEVVDRGVVESPQFDAAVVSSDMSTITNRFSSLSPQCSPVSTEVVDRGVVESPQFDAAVVSSDMLTIATRFSPLNPRVSPVSTEIVD